MSPGLGIPHLPSMCFQLTSRFEKHCSGDISGQILLGTLLCIIEHFISILGLSPLHANSNFSSCGNQNVSRHCLYPLGEKSLPFENYWPTGRNINCVLGSWSDTEFGWDLHRTTRPEGGMMALFILTNHPGLAWLLVAKIMGPRLWKKS